MTGVYTADIITHSYEDCKFRDVLFIAIVV